LKLGRRFEFFGKMGASLLVGETIRTACCTYHRNLLLINIAKRWSAPRR
jgi:hypothetical protein